MKKIVIFFVNLMMIQCAFARDLDFKPEDRVLYDRIKEHVKVVQKHSQLLKKLFDEIEALNNQGDPIDVELRQLTTERSTFNKSLCAPGAKKLLGFYVYTSDKQDDAMAKLQEHQKAVKEHLDKLTQKLKKFETEESMGENCPCLRIMNEWIDDFSNTQCNAVGFGYIAGK